MKRPSQELIAEINALAALDARAIKRRYRELLADVPNCSASGVLRGLVAYRLQERFYGVSLSDAVKARLDGSEGSTGRIRPSLGNLGAGSRLVRNWKGKVYEVTIREDGRFEYEGAIYKSLSAIAKRITGTQWNGKLFFGVKK